MYYIMYCLYSRLLTITQCLLCRHFDTVWFDFVIRCVKIACNICKNQVHYKKIPCEIGFGNMKQTILSVDTTKILQALTLLQP